MTRRRCCCCPESGPPDCESPADGTVSWFTHTVNSDYSITRNNHSGQCYTVYVDSLSGDQDETGDATETNPWQNLNSVFNKNVAKTGTADSLSSGVLTPGGSPDGWTADRFIGRTITLDGVDYTITDNTTTTITIADPPADGSYDWTLHVFDDDCIYAICTTGSCKVKVLLKGTVDYPVLGLSSRNYLRNLVIEPWGVGPAIISVVGSTDVRAVRYCVGCVWKNAEVTGSSTTGTADTYGFSDCDGSAFDTCTGSGSATYSGSDEVFLYAYGFYGCDSSAFDGCTSTSTASGTSSGDGESWAYGWHSSGSSTFNDCTTDVLAEFASTVDTGGSYYESYALGFSAGDYSTFDGCAAEATGTHERPGACNGYGNGYNACNYSTYYYCTGSGTGSADVNGGTGSNSYGDGAGWDYCEHSVFDHCTGTGDATGLNTGGDTGPPYAYAFARGFSRGSYSLFYDCTGNAISEVSGSGAIADQAYSYGFWNNDFSIFDTCDGNGSITGSPTYQVICGFLSNTCSSFFDCTTAGPTCDDLSDQFLRYEETIEGVLTLAPTHDVLDIRETIEGVLKLEITHTIS